MILSDRDIQKELLAGDVVISPKPDFASQLSACWLDLRLANEFYVFEYSNKPYVDLRDKELDMPVKKITVKNGEVFIMQPKEFALGSTLESITLPDYLCGRLEGRSSVGRVGIVVHSTASSVDPGFSGQLTLELGNIGVMPVALYPGMRICSITFEKLTSPAQVPYYKKKTAKYLNQKGPTVSKIIKDLQ